jgi:DNA-directed RNA polymerase subunit RPC12/RpoP
MPDEPPALTRYGRCPCGGHYTERIVQVNMTVDGERVQLDQVPQGACPTCGSRVYKANVLEELEALYGGRPLTPAPAAPPAGR